MIPQTWPGSDSNAQQVEAGKGTAISYFNQIPRHESSSFLKVIPRHLQDTWEL